jgi:hypothetical protein
VATLSFYGVHSLAGGTDVLASTFSLSLQTVIRLFQVSLLVMPVVSGWIAWRICRELSKQQVHPIKQPVGGVIVRTTEGGYEVVEEHEVLVPPGPGQ